MKTKLVKVLGIMLVALFMTSCGGNSEGASKKSNNDAGTISEIENNPVASEIETLNQIANDVIEMAEDYDSDDYEKSLKAAEKVLEMEEDLFDMMDDLDDLDW